MGQTNKRVTISFNEKELHNLINVLIQAVDLEANTGDEFGDGLDETFLNELCMLRDKVASKRS
jgi:hypothetical protein